MIMTKNTAERDMSNVIEIVKKSLIESGHDGLFDEYGGCACLIDDLVPCSSDFSQCIPGYKCESNNPDYDWLMKSHKDKP